MSETSVYFSVGQQPNSRLCRRFWHKTPPLKEGSACRSDRCQHNKQDNRTFVSWAEFEPAIPEVKRLQKYALNRTTTGMRRQVSQQEHIHVPAKHFYKKVTPQNYKNRSKCCPLVQCTFHILSFKNLSPLGFINFQTTSRPLSVHTASEYTPH
jgi:hypothetical protein